MNIIIKSALFFALALIGSMNIAAQSNTINFTAEGDTITTNGQTISVTSTLQKDGNTIIWTQTSQATQETVSFNIMNTEGQWDEGTSTGALTYSLSFNENEATLSLTGASGSINATLLVSVSETQQQAFAFSLNTISYQ